MNADTKQQHNQTLLPVLYGENKPAPPNTQAGIISKEYSHSKILRNVLDPGLFYKRVYEMHYLQLFHLHQGHPIKERIEY